jgi:hypothetical protein
MAHLSRHRSLLHERAGHVAKHRRQIDLLLIMSAHRGAGLLAANRKNRHMVKPGVIKPGNQMRSPWTGRRDANTKLAGELGVRRSHESCHLFVTGLNELDLALGTLQRTEHAVNAVAGIAKYPADAPLEQPLNDEIADSLRHDGTPRARSTWRGWGHNPDSAANVPSA